MNPGGIRADLIFASSQYGEAPGDVTYEEAFTVQPFNNFLVSLDLTGQQIDDAAEPAVSRRPTRRRRRRCRSRDGLHLHCDARDRGGKVDRVDQAERGRPRPRHLPVVTNNFLADGGDSFPAFGTGRQVLRRARHRRLRELPGGQLAVHAGRARPQSRSSSGLVYDTDAGGVSP